jgi:Fic family protein
VNTARSTREKALKAISALAHGFDLMLVASPATKEFLETNHDPWCDNHLTQSNSTPRTAPSQTEAANQPNDNHAQHTNVLQELTNSGHIQLIDVLPSGEGEFMTVQELKDSSDVDLAESTVDRYYRELEEFGIVAVTEPRGSNHVSLTQTGRVAKNRLGNDGTFRHPFQQEITESLTPLSPTQV